MSKHGLQVSRQELKYIIKEETALKVRDFVRSYLELDEFGVGKPDFSYAIHSIYLDSPDLKLYWDGINGNKNRYKLRVRYYDDRPNSPAFFELKRRMDNAILKSRGGVRKSAVPTLLAGHLPENEHLLKFNGKELGALQRFTQLMGELRAKPVALVSYMREAWVSPFDNSIRVTLDRKVSTVPKRDTLMTVDVPSCNYVFGNEVILELKFTGRFPDWFNVLVKNCGCMQSGAAKYAGGIDQGGVEKFRHRPNPASGQQLYY